jgi:hypothetical protein
MPQVLVYNMKKQDVAKALFVQLQNTCTGIFIDEYQKFLAGPGLDRAKFKLHAGLMLLKRGEDLIAAAADDVKVAAEKLKEFPADDQQQQHFDPAVSEAVSSIYKKVASMAMPTQCNIYTALSEAKYPAVLISEADAYTTSAFEQDATKFIDGTNDELMSAIEGIPAVASLKRKARKWDEAAQNATAQNNQKRRRINPPPSSLVALPQQTTTQS